MQSVAAPAVTSFGATPGLVTDGETTSLLAVFTGGTGVVQPGSIAVTSGVPVTVTPTSSATTGYTLTVTNAANTAVTASTSVQSVAAPAVTSFVASVNLVANGTQVLLTPQFTGGTGAIDQGVGAVQSDVGVLVTPPNDQVTSYTLTVQNAAGASVTASVAVEAMAPPTIESFVADPVSVVNGQTTDLTAVFVAGPSGNAFVDQGIGAVLSGQAVTVMPPSNAVTTYVLTVSNPVGSSLALVSVTATSGTPTITTQPVDATVAAGNPATFAVTATGPGPLSYQWLKDGGPIPGATSDTLTIPAASVTDGGTYAVVVFNAYGAAQSEVAVLTVIGSCSTCDGGVVRLRHDLTVNFNTVPPTWCGDAAIAPYVSFDTSGATADQWRLILDTGMKRLEVCPGVTIKTGTVPSNGQQRRAPGVELRSECGIVVHACASIEVQSHNAQAGDIVVRAGGDVVIAGCLLDRARGHLGRSGDIVVASRCGDLRVERHGLVRTDDGGDIQLVTGGAPQWGTGGDILIQGRVETEYREGAPTIRIVAFEGKVSVDSRSMHWLSVAGQRLSTSGVLLRAKKPNASPGRIEIQALGDVAISGNAIGHWAFPNPGAVAIDMHPCGGGGGGVIDVRSLSGRILATDRAIDNSNHDNLLAVNRLWAAGDILLGATGAANCVQNPAVWSPMAMPVVNVGPSANGVGGRNELRSFAGGILLLNPNTVVLAGPLHGNGTPGVNLLTSNAGVQNGGTVSPADPVPGDDSGTVAPAAPQALFGSASGLGILW